MVRAAAKNHPSVAIVTSPATYDAVLAAVDAGGFTLAERQRLAAEAFVHTATYDVHVASWMGNVLTDSSEGSGFPAWMGATWTKEAVLRYGENPHQSAALYSNGFLPEGPGLAQARQHHGKEMSYNNYVDADAARRAAYDFDEPAVAIIKHANPCGIAVGDDVADAHRKAHECDPVSAFGGVIATNVPVSVAMAEQVAEIFTEVVVAPGYEDGAIEVLQAKKNIRILECPPLARGGAEVRSISGGLLLQAARRHLRRGRRPLHLDPRDRGGRLRRGAGRPGVRVARLPRREVERDPARRRPRLRRRRHGTGQPRRLLPPRRRAGGGAGLVRGRRLRRVLPLRRRAADPHRRRREGDRPARRLGARRRGRRCLRGRRRDDVPHRRAALLPLGDATSHPHPHPDLPRMARVTAQTLDGAATLRTIKAELAERVAALRERGVVPGLGTVLVGDDPGSHWYVGAKHKDCAEIGITSIRRDLPATATQAEVEAVIDELNADDACTGFIVQQPTGLDEFALLSRVDPDKDVDGLHPVNLGKLVLGEAGPLPCTPVGSIELLRRHGVEIAGAEVVVVGRGITVGRPLGLLLTRRSENATVTLCHTGTRDLAAHVRTADIVVAAAGVPGIITADMVKPGAAVLDVGVSRVDGKVTGDVHPDVWDVAGWVSPNPKGVGPMTRAMLLTNIVEIAERSVRS